MATNKVGLFFIGGLGSTSSLTIFTIALLQNELIPKDKNFITSLEYFNRIKFLEPSEIHAIGGLDVKKDNLYNNVKAIVERDRLNVKGLLENESIKKTFKNWDDNFGVGVLQRNIKGNKNAIDRIKRIITNFQEKSNLDRVIVIYLSSAEENVDNLDNISLSKLKKIISENTILLPPNILYTYAIIDLGLPFINFTSCQANCIEAIKELADVRKVAHCGRDGKTGETYIKSVLATAFKFRNFRMLFWESHNILGDNDGLTLQDAQLKKNKLLDKSLSVKALGDDIEHNVRIDFVKDLGDWKTAWDLIEWEGLLGSRMSLQFTWKGHDGLLAAPLIWDLIRFVDLSVRNHDKGVLKHLSFFFKNPIDCNIYDAIEQFNLLKNYYSSS